MVWLVEKSIVHHLLDCGFERVTIPVRVKFELEVREGAVVAHSMSKSILYNRQAIEKRYPDLRSAELEAAINETVMDAIRSYVRESGWSGGDNLGEVGGMDN